MAKKIGISAVVISVLGVIFAITVFAFKYAYGADTKVVAVEKTVTAKVEAVKDRVIVNEVKVEGISVDLQRIETQQKANHKEHGDKLHMIWLEVKK